MLNVWQRRTMRNKSGRAQDGAPIACTPGESNPIAAQNFICASSQQPTLRIENIRRCL
jgi:hypothetical protein